MRPPPRAQVAQLVVAHSGGERRGSGYLVGVDTVLAPAHVVDGAEPVLVRFEPDLPGERTAAAVSWRSHPHADVAVVEIEPVGDLRSAAFGRVSERAARLRGRRWDSPGGRPARFSPVRRSDPAGGFFRIEQMPSRPALGTQTSGWSSALRLRRGERRRTRQHFNGGRRRFRGAR
ncbi:hypothetical protein ACFXPA_49145, partial [Amycolatopsis sp. NPDC059090]|uniref:hypothetical protein n=1 Tax=Amycolatopsis sp. NPDC059090 TaxID=3346723 RepID=UPI00366E157D